MKCDGVKKKKNTWFVRYLQGRKGKVKSANRKIRILKMRSYEVKLKIQIPELCVKEVILSEGRKEGSYHGEFWVTVADQQMVLKCCPPN